MSQAKAIRKNVFFKTLLSFSELLSSALTFPIAARLLKPETIGEVDLSITAANYFITICSFGISEFASREIGAVRSKGGEISSQLSGLLVFRFILTFLSFTSFAFIVTPLYPHSTTYLWMASLSILFSSLNVTWALDAFESYTFLTYSRIFSKIILLVGVLFFVTSPQDGELYLGLQVLSDAVYFLISFVLLNKKINFVFTSIIKSLKEIQYSSLIRIFGINIIQATLSSLPFFILGHFEMFEEIGVFSTANRFFWLGYYFIIPISTVLTVRSYWIAGSHSSVRESGLSKSLGLLLMIGLPIMVGVFLTSENIIPVFVGHDFLRSITSLKILSTLVPIYILNSFFSMQILFPLRKEGVIFKSYAIGTISIPFQFLLLNSLDSVHSASLMLLISNLIVCFSLLIRSKDYFTPVEFYPDFFKSFAAVVVMAVVVALLGANVGNDHLIILIVKILSGIASYALSLFIFRHGLFMRAISDFK